MQSRLFLFTLTAGTVALASCGNEPTENNSPATQYVAAPIFDPPAGSYTEVQEVTITCATSGATVYYTTDGSTPSAASLTYAGPFIITQSTTVKARATKDGFEDSPIVTADYVVQIVEAPTFSPPGSTYDTEQSVAISTATPGATIHYTLDGSDPTTSSAVYSAPLTVDTSATVKAFAAKTDYGESPIASADYVLVVLDPTFDPPAGTYTTTQSVALACATSGATIHYTLDGSDPTSGSNVYSSPIPVAAPTTVKAIAVYPGREDSSTVAAEYVIQVSAPTFTPPGGSYATAQSVAISTTTPASTIYFTTDNSDPTAASTVYSTPIDVSTNTTIKAFATKSGLADSAVATGTFVITTEQAEPPVFSPAPGLHSDVTDVSISSATGSASIYYTTDGSTPTAASTLYTGTIPGTMDVTRTIRAIAVASGMLDSAVVTGMYELPDVDGDTVSLPEENHWHILDTLADTDSDGVDDDEEIRVWGTRPDLDDTDGDGIADGVELVDYGYANNWTTQTYRFNPLIADVPKINVALLAPPEVVATVTTSTVTSETVTAERSGSSATTISSADSTTHSRSVERTHEASAGGGFSAFGPSVSASYSLSVSTSNETSVSYTEEQSSQNTQAWRKMNAYMNQAGYTYEGGTILARVGVENLGNLSVELSDLSLVAVRADPAAESVHPLATITSSGFSMLSVAGGTVSGDLVFEGDVQQQPMEEILADPDSLVIKPSTYTLNVLDEDGNIRAFTHNFNAIDSNCARIVVDYGPYNAGEGVGYLPPEQHYVATNLRYGSNDGITLEQAFEDHMHLNDAAIGTTYNSYLMGTTPVFVCSTSVPPICGTQNRMALRSFRGLDNRDATNAHWVIVHRYTEGAEVKYTAYRAVDAAYSLSDIVLHAGDVVHILYMKDSDGDNLGIREEYAYGSSDDDTDSDDDGLSDWDEVNTYFSDPGNPNSPVYKYTVTLAMLQNFYPSGLAGDWISQTRYDSAWTTSSETYTHFDGTVPAATIGVGTSYQFTVDRDSLDTAEIWLWGSLDPPIDDSVSLTIPRHEIFEPTARQFSVGGYVISTFYITPLY